jgi:ethanolamine-phosphate cytidylyltransferase
VCNSDVFATAKKAGRFKTVKRTEGVSTTEIVGRMLLMTKSHFRRGSEADRPRSQSSAGSSTDVVPFRRSSAFLPTARRINQFSSGRTPKPNDKVVYIDGAWDMFHAGHIDILRKAKALGNFLLVGVHTDEAVNTARGAHTNYPILNLHERVLSVLSCKYVDEVIIGAPWRLTEDMIRSMNISVVAHGSVSDIADIKTLRANPSTNPYAVGEALGICVELQSSRNLTTSVHVMCYAPADQCIADVCMLTFCFCCPPYI